MPTSVYIAPPLKGGTNYGKGTDGSLTVSACVTLTANKQYTNLTINAGGTLCTAGKLIRVKCTLTMTGGIIRDLASGGAGGPGGCGSVSGSPGAAGSGGTTPATVSCCGTNVTPGQGGGGGGGGGGGAGAGTGTGGKGGPGGQGGGMPRIFAKKVNLKPGAVRICAKGQNGSPGCVGSCGGACGGGGGGGGGGGPGHGGFIRFVWCKKTGCGFVCADFSANGGSPGAGACGNNNASAAVAGLSGAGGQGGCSGGNIGGPGGAAVCGVCGNPGCPPGLNTGQGGGGASGGGRGPGLHGGKGGSGSLNNCAGGTVCITQGTKPKGGGLIFLNSLFS